MNIIHVLPVYLNMRRIPNFVLLRAFEAAARLESFTLAAKELNLTQSAISHQVKELEEFFNELRTWCIYANGDKKKLKKKKK